VRNANYIVNWGLNSVTILSKEAVTCADKRYHSLLTTTTVRSFSYGNQLRPCV